jgi:predicted DNA-binding transcriptional regulator AlpA
MARAEITGRKDVEIAAMSITDFCRSVGISKGSYYNYRSEGRGPKEVHIGSRVLITTEERQAWLKRHTVKT